MLWQAEASRSSETASRRVEVMVIVGDYRL
jgi:hypothetical protein